jgi:hypothetical protein
MYPDLNTKEAIRNITKRNLMADIIQNIIIPAVLGYQQPGDFKDNHYEVLHIVYKDKTVAYLNKMVQILQNTNEPHVVSEYWMDVNYMKIIIQALPVIELKYNYVPTEITVLTVD